LPISYQLERESALVQTCCRGDVTFEEVADHFRELGAEPDLPPQLDVLIDLREASSLPETGQIRSLMLELEQLQGRVKWGAWAVVASSDAMFGIARMFQAFAEGHFQTSRVCRELEEARSWLASGAPDPM
jgi:hypothetical protein